MKSYKAKYNIKSNDTTIQQKNLSHYKGNISNIIKIKSFDNKINNINNSVKDDCLNTNILTNLSLGNGNGKSEKNIIIEIKNNNDDRTNDYFKDNNKIITDIINKKNIDKNQLIVTLKNMLDDSPVINQFENVKKPLITIHDFDILDYNDDKNFYSLNV